FCAYLLWWPKPPDPRVLPLSEVDWTETYSNIVRADYVGPNTCKECHPTQHSRWRQHPHSKMNRLPGPDSVPGDFHTARLVLPTSEAHFDTAPDGRYFMSVIKDDTVYRRYVVTRTVGSRFMQFYIGKQLEGPEPETDPIYQEHMLPFSYWFKLKR